MMQTSSTPFPQLQTERLLLRQPQDADAEALAILRSDPAVNHFLDREPTSSPAAATVFIHKINASIAAAESLYWIICIKETQQLAGTICLWNIEPESSTAETGFELLPAYWGKGLMREAISAVLDYGFEKMMLQQINAFTRHDNTKSIQLLERSRFLPGTEADTDDGYRGYYLLK